MHIFERALRDRRVALVWWTVGVATYCALIVAVWPVIDSNEDLAEIYAEMPDALQAMFGADGFTGLTSPSGFLNAYLYSMILPFIFTGLAVSLGSSLLAGEEEDELLDLVLSYPVQRRTLVVQKASAMGISIVGIGTVTVALLAVAKEPVDLDVGLSGLVAATLGSVLFAVVHGLVALLAGAATGSKGVATGAGWGVALGGYLLNVIANLDDSLDWLATFSPVYWATADTLVTGTFPATYLALGAAAVVLLLASLAVFDRHDLS